MFWSLSWLFEVKWRINQLNNERNGRILGYQVRRRLCSCKELINNKVLEIGFRIARLRMKFYEEISAYIYDIYLGYFSVEDIYAYSIDEAFIDVISYLKLYIGSNYGSYYTDFWRVWKGYVRRLDKLDIHIMDCDEFFGNIE